MMRPIHRIRTWFSGLSGIEKKQVWSITAAVLAGILLYIFEPFTPYYAFGILIVGLYSAGMIVHMFHRRGIRVVPAAWRWVCTHKWQFVLSLVSVTLIWLVFLFLPMGRSPFAGMTDDEIAGKINADYESLKISIFKMDNVLRGLQKHRSLFRLKELEDLSSEERKMVLEIWSEFMDHMLLYDELVGDYRYFYRIAPFSKAELHDHAYLTGYTAFISRYLYGWELLNIVMDNKIWATILNEENGKLGLPPDCYDRVKQNVTKPNEIARLTVGYAHLNFLRSRMDDDFEIREGEVFTYVDDCFLKCAGNLAIKSPVYFPKNSLDSFKKKTFEIWFPFQKGAAGVTGHIRLTARSDNYISEKDLAAFEKLLEPGDILVERRNWYLSNVGIPGFWPHAALYLGTRERFCSFFGNDPEVDKYVEGVTVQQYLQKNYNQAWSDFKDNYCIIESIAPGVVLNTMKGSAGADYAAAMRPLRTKKEKFIALCRAFSYYGRPYDYNFDFVTDSELVCTELVFKSYMPAEQTRGLDIPLITHAGRELCTAQVFVKMFDNQYGTPEQQLEFAAFLDYKPEDRKVVLGTVQDFRDSWKRPKWSVLLE